MTRQVSVNIDRLVIHGEADARRIADGIRAELERALRLPGAIDAVLSSSAARAQGPAARTAQPGIRAVPNATGRDIGVAVTRRILGVSDVRPR